MSECEAQTYRQSLYCKNFSKTCFHYNILNLWGRGLKVLISSWNFGYAFRSIFNSRYPKLKTKSSIYTLMRGALRVLCLIRGPRETKNKQFNIPAEPHLEFWSKCLSHIIRNVIFQDFWPPFPFVTQNPTNPNILT
jgi:hypothetical protein